MGDNIEIITRGVIRHEGKILLCKAKTKKNWYFPGGHVEIGETGREALKREIQEEIGMEISVGKFLGVSENFYRYKEEEHQEINLVHEAEFLDKGGEVRCREDHLEFCWLDENDLDNIYVLPESLKKAVLDWIKSGEAFHIEEKG